MMLALIKHALKVRDTQHILDTGVKRCWFVYGFHEVTRWLRALDRPGNEHEQSIHTYDFATMYTTLEQDNIVDSLRFAIMEAFGTSYIALRYNGSSKPFSWVEAHEASEVSQNDRDFYLYTADEITKLVEILVRNTYIQNDAHLRRQTVGPLWAPTLPPTSPT